MKNYISTIVVAIALASFLSSLAAQPVDECGRIEECAAKLRDELRKKGMLGVGFHCDQDYTDDGATLFRVALLVPESPAERAGLRMNDLVFDLNDRTFMLEEQDDFHAQISNVKLGQPYVFRLLRRGEEHEVSVEPAPITEEFFAYQFEFHLRKSFSDSEVDRYLQSADAKEALSASQAGTS